MLILERPWTRQPQGAVGVDKNNNITRGLVAVVNPGICAIDLISGKSFTPYGDIKRTPSVNGVGANFATANSAYEAPGDKFDSIVGTIFCLCTVLSGSTTNGGIFTLSSSSDSGAAPYAALSLKVGPSSNALFGSSNSSYTTVTTSAGTLATNAGTKEQWFGRARSGLQILNYYVNGSYVPSTNGSAAGELLFSTGRRIIVGEDYRLASRSGGRQVELGAIWDRFLSDFEIVELLKNPWQLFAPRRIYIPTATATATAPTITALSAISITATSAQPRISYS